MAGVVRLAGVKEGSIDPEHGRASFALKFATGQTLTCIADLGEVEEIAVALGRIAQEIRRTSPPKAVAKDVLAYDVVCDRTANRVLIRLVTPGGISHTFALAADWARDLSMRLTAQTLALAEAGSSDDP
jgi:hypothetical protein